jgi:hypothetical protein
MGVKYGGKSVTVSGNSLNPRKCGNCSANMFCAHKFGTGEEIRFHSKYEEMYNINEVSYPQELVEIEQREKAHSLWKSKLSEEDIIKIMKA